jgi:small subunit ribosomal protein S2
MALPQIIKELLENGVHFGHLSKHWNPKMKKFIFGKKKNVYIIDLEKTAQKLEEARDFVKQLVQQGGKILFVATKRQLRDLIKEQAQSCDMPYVVERWVGGFLTNALTVRSRVKKYVDLIEKKNTGGFDKMTKKEIGLLNRDIERMGKIYSGVVSLDDLPTCIFVIDPKKETACIREANKLSIPIVALIDTDANPEVVDYPIPGNDDAIKSVKYIVEYMVEAIKAGAQKGEELVEKGAGQEKEEGQKEEVGEAEEKTEETAEEKDSNSNSKENTDK